jgi:hypothetical protein
MYVCIYIYIYIYIHLHLTLTHEQCHVHTLAHQHGKSEPELDLLSKPEVWTKRKSTAVSSIRKLAFDVLKLQVSATHRAMRCIHSVM